MSIDYERFARVLHRCKEVADDPEINEVVKHVHKQVLASPAEEFLAADATLGARMVAYERENTEALKALGDLDGPYRIARSTLIAIHPETAKAVPDTLKSLPTDTDKLRAIERLLDTIDDHIGTEWADALLKGEFGAKAAKALKEINEGIAANKSLSDATGARSKAYGPAYEKYLAFKRVVRDALGPGSKHYRRIHLRASPGAAAASATDAMPEPVAEAPVPPPAPVDA
jgi:hypothetical protein